jgi:F-type H+-transporting ATPase subunit b
MPQLAQLALVYQSQWFWLLLSLGVIYAFVGRGIVPRVEATVDLRDARIADDLAEAERLRVEAAAAEEDLRKRLNDVHAEAQAAIAQAKSDAAKATEKRLSAADRRFSTRMAEAAALLDEARRSALAEIEDVAADAASAIVAKLTGAKVGETAAREAVTGALNRA